MGWWGFTFPIGVFTSATLQFGTELDSVAFKVLGTIFTVCLVLLWIVVAVGTTIKAWQGVMSVRLACLRVMRLTLALDRCRFMAPCLDDGGCLPPVKSHNVVGKTRADAGIIDGLPVDSGRRLNEAGQGGPG